MGDLGQLSLGLGGGSGFLCVLRPSRMNRASVTTTAGERLPAELRFEGNTYKLWGTRWVALAPRRS